MMGERNYALLVLERARSLADVGYFRRSLAEGFAATQPVSLSDSPRLRPVSFLLQPVDV